jgi:hypothetical protein
MPSVELVSGTPHVVIAHESGAAGYKAGDLVQFDTGGYVAVGTTTDFCAIARKDEGSVANVECEIELLSTDNLYSIKGVSGTTLAQTAVGDGFVITFTEGGHYVTVGTDSDGAIVGLLDPIGTNGGRYIVKFFDSVIKTGLIGA